jgi:hypothetical protein
MERYETQSLTLFHVNYSDDSFIFTSHLVFTLVDSRELSTINLLLVQLIHQESYR